MAAQSDLGIGESLPGREITRDSARSNPQRLEAASKMWRMAARPELVSFPTRRTSAFFGSQLTRFALFSDVLSANFGVLMTFRADFGSPQRE